LRLPHFIDNWLTDIGEVVNLTCYLPSSPQADSWFSFLLEVESSPGLEGLGRLKNPMTSSGLEPMTFQLVAYTIPIVSYTRTVTGVQTATVLPSRIHHHSTQGVEGVGGATTKKRSGGSSAR
jgi:hypothetical protein